MGFPLRKWFQIAELREILQSLNMGTMKIKLNCKGASPEFQGGQVLVIDLKTIWNFIRFKNQLSNFGNKRADILLLD
jgi:hypothetical protein